MITSINNSNIILLKKLQQDSKYRKTCNSYCIEGVRLLSEASKYNKRVTAVYCQSDKLTSLPSGLTCAIIEVDNKIIKYISDTVTNQGIISVLEIEHDNFVVSAKCLILDNIADPGNMGALLRSAVAFGFDTVIAVNCVDVYSPKVIRSAMSAHFACNIVTCAEVSEAYAMLDGHTVVVADMSGTPVDRWKQVDKVALVLGNEGNGVTQQALDGADWVVSIPMDNNFESLNVAVAGSLLMYLL